jgi:hypothetical protein
MFWITQPCEDVKQKATGFLSIPNNADLLLPKTSLVATISLTMRMNGYGSVI